jgi:hypothetical protein
LAPLPDITTDARAVVIERMEFYIREVNAAVQSALGQYQSVGDLTRETRIAVA